MLKTSYASLLCLLLAASTFASPGAAEEDTTAPVYRQPAPELESIVTAPMTPWVLPGPGAATLAVMDWTMMSTLADLTAPELRLAGQRFSPRSHGPTRSRPFVNMSLFDLDQQKMRPVSGIPDGSRFINVRWSPSGHHLSFTRLFDERIELWVVDAAKAAAHRVIERPLSLVHGEAPAWIDDRSLLLTLIDGAANAPQRPDAPGGPVIQENLGVEAPARTYQDLLADEHDEATFEHYLTTRLARVDLDGKVTPIGDVGMFSEFDPSPDGRYVLVEILHRPFSYQVPASRFPKRTEIWNLADGSLVHQLDDRPLMDRIPIPFGSVATGVRNAQWRTDQPATVAWVEAQDGGDAGRDADIRDRLFQLAAPFDAEATKLADLGLRFGGIEWGDDDLALLSSWWWKDRSTRTWRLHPGVPGSEPQLLIDRSFEDRYSDPGTPVTEVNAWGREVIRRSPDGGSIYLEGDGASAEGERPFLDRFDLETLTAERLFHSAPPYYETPVEILDDEARRLLTRRESAAEPLNLFIRDLKSDSRTQLTEFPHPTPQLLGMSKELIQYQRDDGVQLSATLYLPPGYDKEKHGPLPVVMWAYPQEYKSADAASQIDGSPHRFDRIGWWSPLVWLTRGYAVLDDPKMPIVGEGEVEPNDTFRQQLVSSAQAAVDEMVRRGVGDPQRMAIGGHSYGAFMTANLLAHSDLFAAGIARSGAYNRTLTPFGFQSEERTVWQAPEVYFAMSPFMHAEKVNEPILLIHGDSDNNSGTYPMQSERYYAALKGLGATARLVMLPAESHGYQAEESILHMLWETDRWLEQYVKTRREPASIEGVPTEGVDETPGD